MSNLLWEKNKLSVPPHYVHFTKAKIKVSFQINIRSFNNRMMKMPHMSALEVVVEGQLVTIFMDFH